MIDRSIERFFQPDTVSMLSSEPNLVHSGTAVLLTVSTDSLVLKRLTDLQTLYSHKMEGISFASAGEHVREERGLSYSNQFLSSSSSV